MRYLLVLAARSAWNRRATLLLTATAIALSVALLLGVERVRHDARESFTQSISGTDLVVGARTSPVQLMLYAVFRVGEVTNDIRWKTYLALAEHPEVAWAIPLSLGDSHRGFPVMGTSVLYFDRFRYAEGRHLEFTAGRRFDGLFDAVLGAEVAERLGYRLGDRMVLNHGTGDIGLAEHADKPFTVAGILARTGTPVDQTVHVSLEALEALHLDWQGGTAIPGFSIPAEYASKFDLTPKRVTAVLLGLKSRAAVFGVQRYVNEYAAEPLVAALPGVALDELWRVVALVERALLGVSAMVVGVGLAGLVAVVLAGLNERRRELAILRATGARPRDILFLLVAECGFVALVGILAGVALVTVATLLFGPIALSRYGLTIRPLLLLPSEFRLIAAVFGTALISSLIPAYRAYMHSLVDGLTPRL